MKSHHFPLYFNPWSDTEWSQDGDLEPGIVAGSFVVKMGGFRLSSHVSPCSESCYTTLRIKKPKEPSGGSEAFLCISNQDVIF